MQIQQLQIILIIKQRVERRQDKIRQDKDMLPKFKPKQIPYSRIQNDQLLHPDSSLQDIIVPDEHKSLAKTMNVRGKNNNQSLKNKQEINSNKTVNYAQVNAFNRNYASSSSYQNIEKKQSSKRLTHGMTSYKDIKSSYNTNARADSGQKKSRSSSKVEKLNQQCINKPDRESLQCTFTPKTNNKGISYKNFNDFVNFQENFITKREEKISKMKEQKTTKQKSEIRSIPSIDKKSRKISQSIQEYKIDNYGSLKKMESKTPVHQRLYNIPRKKDRIVEEETSFTPTILNKSKSMVRNDRVDNLLYEDAQRRKGQQQLMKSEAFRKQTLNNSMSMSSKWPPQQSHISERQSKTNMRLICNKIRNQFIQLLQSEQQNDEEQIQMNNMGNNIDEHAVISPILSVTIISELFNVQLNPNKNEELCWKVVNYLLPEDSTDTKQSCDNQYVEAKKLWEFIKAIVAGPDGFQKEPTSFSVQEISTIHKQLGYFYSQRLSKQPCKIQPEQQAEQYRIQTSKTTNRLAQIHRSKKLQQISQFISDTKIDIINNMFNSVKNNNRIMTEAQEKIIRLQDLLILDSIRKKAEIQQKKMKKDEEQMKQCSFRPSLNEKSIQKAKQRRSKSKKYLKTINECQQLMKQQSYSKEKQNIETKKNPNKKIVIKSKNNEGKPKLNYKPIESSLENRSSFTKTCQSIKNVDKTLLRLNIARKMRDVQNFQKMRGYGKSSENWLKETQCQKKQVLQQVSNFLGYKENIQFDQSPITRNKQNTNEHAVKIKQSQ